MKQIRETSDFVANKIVSKYTSNQHFIKKILEPSFGDGKLIEHLMDSYYFLDSEVYACELNKERFEKGKDNLSKLTSFTSKLQANKLHLYNQNFLLWDNDIKDFDLILAAPPFKNNIDLDHINLMYSFIKRRWYNGIFNLTILDN